MGIFALIVGGLTALPAALAGLKDLIGALGKLYDEISGGDHDKVDAITQQAQDVVGLAETDVDTVKRWLTDSYPTVDALVQEFSGLPKLLYAAKNLAADQNIGKHAALTTVQLAANALKQSQS
jgi:hypothetical protein